jgi:hypothetical protein
MNSVNSKVLQDKDKPSLKSDQQQGLPSWQACVPDSPFCCVCIRLGKCQLLPNEDSSTYGQLLEQMKCSSVLQVQLCGLITSARHQRLKDCKWFTRCKYVIGAHDGCNKDANCTAILYPTNQHPCKEARFLAVVFIGGKKKLHCKRVICSSCSHHILELGGIYRINLPWVTPFTIQLLQLSH